MRKSNVASLAGKASRPAAGPGETPVQLVCLALALALIVLAARIVSIW
jgi:hypothetical protein